MMYAYCRVSTKHQNIQRQIDNIRSKYPEISDNCYYIDHFTGKTIERPNWIKLKKRLKESDTIVFDSVSRLSRNASEGSDVYEELYQKGVNIVFLNEPSCNTEIYKNAQKQCIASTGNEIADIYVEATNKVLMLLAKRQIQIAFEQAEKERNDICTRVRDGMRSKKEELLQQGVEIHYGLQKGTKLVTKKSIEAKGKIKKYSICFNGTLQDTDVIKIVGISRNTYYKYKAELKQEIESTV